MKEHLAHRQNSRLKNRLRPLLEPGILPRILGQRRLAPTTSWITHKPEMC